jgi:REP element-mobilizing transposase RayT
MTAPRRIVRNATVLVTRRCFERRMFLRPSDELNELVLYLLAVSTERFGIQLHAYCFLSNHVHLVLTDPLGALPAFEQYLSSLLARSCNAMHGRWESFWAPGSYSAVTLETPSDVIDKMAYTLANPVSAGLVRRGGEWPGIRSSPESMSAPPVRVKRPDRFFRAHGPMPASATLRVVPPPGTTCLAELRTQLRAEVTKLEDKAARELAAKGWGFLGARRVLAQRPFARPAGVEPRRGLRPRVGARDKWKRIEAIGRLQAFLGAYREAWLQFASGVRDAVFPHGTYWMRVAYGVQCAPAD